MPSYRYEAVNASGARMEGILGAPDDKEAQRELRRRGLVPVALVPAIEGKVRRGRQRVTQRDRISAVLELATLLDAGLPIAEALDALVEGASKPAIGDGFAEMARRLKRGEAVPAAFRVGMPNLPEYAYLLVEAGDQTGQLASALKDAAGQLDYQERVRQDLRQALTYPLFLVLAGMAAVVFILMVVVPRFSTMFGGRFDQLPLISRIVMRAGVFTNENSLAVLLSVAALAAAVVWSLRQTAVRSRIYGLALRLPAIGPWLMSLETARWAGILATLLGNRVPLIRALDLAAGGLGSTALANGLEQVKRAVRGGVALSRALGDYTPFDAAALSLVRIGERAGNLPAMLKSLASLLEDASRTRMKRVLALMEPMAILLIGGVIGVFVTAIILAITSINTMPL